MLDGPPLLCRAARGQMNAEQRQHHMLTESHATEAERRTIVEGVHGCRETNGSHAPRAAQGLAAEKTLFHRTPTPPHWYLGAHSRH